MTKNKTRWENQAYSPKDKDRYFLILNNKNEFFFMISVYIYF